MKALINRLSHCKRTHHSSAAVLAAVEVVEETRQSIVVWSHSRGKKSQKMYAGLQS